MPPRPPASEITSIFRPPSENPGSTPDITDSEVGNTITLNQCHIHILDLGITYGDIHYITELQRKHTLHFLSCSSHG